METPSAVERLDRFSRRWPLSMCFGVFAHLGATAGIDGELAAALVYGLLALLVGLGLAWVLTASEG